MVVKKRFFLHYGADRTYVTHLGCHCDPLPRDATSLLKGNKPMAPTYYNNYCTFSLMESCICNYLFWFVSMLVRQTIAQRETGPWCKKG